MPATLDVARPMAHKSLIDDALWLRLTIRIREDLEFQGHFGLLDEAEQTTWAERILNETLGFLRLCVTDPMHIFRPSVLVDIGWHAFILCTKAYFAFCKENAGHYIHHEPGDGVGASSTGYNPAGTMQAMQQAGLAVNPELWSFGIADCKSRPKPGCGGGCTCAV